MLAIGQRFYWLNKLVFDSVNVEIVQINIDFNKHRKKIVEKKNIKII
jgi:hypothetical protein